APAGRSPWIPEALDSKLVEHDGGGALLMAIHHADSGEIIDVRPLGEGLKQAITTTLVKTDRLEVIRLVLAAGKEIAEHRAPGEITVQCLEGAIEFQAHGRWQTLEAG